MIPTINFEKKIKEIGGKPWSPVDVVKVNDQILRMALFKGEFHWHVHDNEDELFYIVKGEITIQLEGHPDIIARQGEMAIVPKGIRHCPKSEIDSYVIMFEPSSLKIQGS
jgi:mannose-6-phosphate isomerase-like protein (cupin superfamily)